MVFTVTAGAMLAELTGVVDDVGTLLAGIVGEAEAAEAGGGVIGLMLIFKPENICLGTLSLCANIDAISSIGTGGIDTSQSFSASGCSVATADHLREKEVRRMRGWSHCGNMPRGRVGEFWETDSTT